MASSNVRGRGLMFRRAIHIAVGVFVAGVVALAPVSSALADRYWQCVPFARLVSGIQIFGDAHTWWRQATGRYETGVAPRAGSVLCFKPSGSMSLGHVAVVSQVLTDRVIQITHANWSRIGGARGQIERDVTVIDGLQPVQLRPERGLDGGPERRQPGRLHGASGRLAPVDPRPGRGRRRPDRRPHPGRHRPPAALRPQARLPARSPC